MPKTSGASGPTQDAVDASKPTRNGSHGVLITVRQVMFGTVAAMGMRPAKTRRVRRHVMDRCEYFESARMSREMDRL